MKVLSLVRIVGTAATMAALLALASVATAQSTDSARINELLKSVKGHAALASHDADLLESYTRSNVSWESHAIQVNSMKEHVNNLISDHNEMITARADASPWQQKAIDRTDPLVKEMADRLTAVINHLNDNKANFKMQAYRDYVKSNHTVIATLDKMVSDFVDYEESKSTADMLEEKLELPSSAGEGE